jgi:hypothetical protein
LFLGENLGRNEPQFRAARGIISCSARHISGSLSPAARTSPRKRRYPPDGILDYPNVAFGLFALFCGKRRDVYCRFTATLRDRAQSGPMRCMTPLVAGGFPDQPTM